jgi:hypothetical protein
MNRPLNGFGMRFVLHAIVAAAGFLAQGPVLAQEDFPFGDPDERWERLEPPLALPQSHNIIIRPGTEEPAPARIDTLREVGLAIRACWRPSGEPHSGQDITVRVSFKRNGEVLGKPMITHYGAGRSDGGDRQAFTQAVRDAFVRCSPMPFTEKLGAAVAGRPFTFRFIDSPPSRAL